MLYVYSIGAIALVLVVLWVGFLLREYIEREALLRSFDELTEAVRAQSAAMSKAQDESTEFYSGLGRTCAQQLYAVHAILVTVHRLLDESSALIESGRSDAKSTARELLLLGLGKLDPSEYSGIVPLETYEQLTNWQGKVQARLSAVQSELMRAKGAREEIATLSMRACKAAVAE